MRLSQNIAGKSRALVSRAIRPGMTLMEVVIAIAVVAFVVPLILAATGSAGSSRRNAEADTRSAWIAREVQRQIILKWSDNTAVEDQSDIDTAFPFPGTGLGVSSKTLIFDKEGEFLSEGSSSDVDSPSQIPDAAYVVTVKAERYTPPGANPSANPSAGQDALVLVGMNIIHPAKASKASRSTFRYNLITTKQGTL